MKNELLFVLTALVFIEVKRINEIAKKVEPLISCFFFGFFGCGGLFIGGGVIFFVERNTGLIENVLFDKNRHFSADSQGDCVAWARIDFESVTSLLNDDTSIKRTIVDIIHDNMANARAKLAKNGFKQVVGHWALWLVALQRKRDSIGLECADPDGNIFPAISFAQNYYTMLSQQAHADTVNSYTNHEIGLSAGSALVTAGASPYFWGM